jgi:DNA-binding NarL/FixJ family response regulator
MVGIAVCTDSPILARGLESLLQEQADWRYLGFRRSDENLLGWVQSITPDLLVLDEDAEFTLAFVAQLHRAAPSCRILLWTKGLYGELVDHALEVGIRGVLPKSALPEEVMQTLRRVVAGAVSLEGPPPNAFVGPQHPVKLTRREGQLLALVSRGMRNREIAAALSITEGTVKVYLSRLLHKTGLRNRYQLALYGTRNLGQLGGGNGDDAMALHSEVPRAGDRATRWCR